MSYSPSYTNFGLNPAPAYPPFAGGPVLPPCAFRYDAARDDPLIDDYERCMAYGGPSVEVLSGWDPPLRYVWQRLEQLSCARRHWRMEKENIPAVPLPLQAPWVAAPPPLPGPSSAPCEQLGQGSKARKGKSSTGKSASPRSISRTAGAASHTHSLPPTAQKAVATGFFKGHCTVKSKSMKGHRKDRKPLCAVTDLAADEKIPYDKFDDIDCLWAGCSGHQFQKAVMHSKERSKNWRHMATIVEQASIQGSEKRPSINCLWDNCNARFAVSHLPKHLLDVHFGRDWFCCKWCDTLQRHDSYLTDHGRAELCRYNPQNIPRDRLRAFLSGGKGTELAHQRAVELLEQQPQPEFVPGSSRTAPALVLPPAPPLVPWSHAVPSLAYSAPPALAHAAVPHPIPVVLEQSSHTPPVVASNVDFLMAGAAPLAASYDTAPSNPSFHAPPLEQAPQEQPQVQLLEEATPETLAVFKEICALFGGTSDPPSTENLSFDGLLDAPALPGQALAGEVAASDATAFYDGARQDDPVATFSASFEEETASLFGTPPPEDPVEFTSLDEWSPSQALQSFFPTTVPLPVPTTSTNISASTSSATVAPAGPIVAADLDILGLATRGAGSSSTRWF